MTHLQRVGVKTGAQISFRTHRELTRWLAGRGYRVSRWNADGTFDTEKIESEFAAHLRCASEVVAGWPAWMRDALGPHL